MFVQLFLAANRNHQGFWKETVSRFRARQARKQGGRPHTLPLLKQPLQISGQHIHLEVDRSTDLQRLHCRHGQRMRNQLTSGGRPPRWWSGSPIHRDRSLARNVARELGGRFDFKELTLADRLEAIFHGSLDITRYQLDM